MDFFFKFMHRRNYKLSRMSSFLHALLVIRIIYSSMYVYVCILNYCKLTTPDQKFQIITVPNSSTYDVTLDLTIITYIVMILQNCIGATCHVEDTVNSALTSKAVSFFFFTFNSYVYCIFHSALSSYKKVNFIFILSLTSQFYFYYYCTTLCNTLQYSFVCTFVLP